MLEDFVGNVFDRLTVVSFNSITKDHQRSWNCACMCGNTCTVTSHNLTSGRKRSCGCLSRELSSKRQTIHGLRNDAIYGILDGMKKRCYSVNHKNYKHYGARGITIHQEWLESSASFFSWAKENGYREGLQIDRIDNDKGYSPDNCRWVNRICNNINRRASNKSGFTGIVQVSYSKLYPFMCAVKLKGNQNYLGWFATVEEAIAVRKAFVDGFTDRYGHYLDEEITQDLCTEYVNQFMSTHIKTPV